MHKDALKTWSKVSTLLEILHDFLLKKNPSHGLQMCAKSAPKTCSFPLALLPTLPLTLPSFAEVHFLKNNFPKTNNTTVPPLLFTVSYIELS